MIYTDRKDITETDCISLLENKPSEVSKILFHAHKQAKRIKKKIEEIDEQKLLHYWQTEKLSSSRISQWKSMLPVQSTENKDISVFQVFESGL